MRTELILLDSDWRSAGRRIRRTIAAIAILLLLSMLWYGWAMTKSYRGKADAGISKRKTWISIALLLAVLGLALGAQVPKYARHSIVYGAMVGLVVYGAINATLLMVQKEWSYDIALIDTVWGVLSTSAAAFLVSRLA